MLQKSLFYVLLGMIAAWTCPQVLADANSCLQAVEQQHFERLSTTCIDLPHRDRLQKMKLMMTGGFNHHLGTVTEPSPAFKLLREMAEANDRNAQYMYGQLYATVHIAAQNAWQNHHANDGKTTLNAYNKSVRNEAHKWLIKAAERGHSLAMIEVAEGDLLRSFTQSGVDLKSALQIARNATTTNPLLANDLIDRLQKRIRDYY